MAEERLSPDRAERVLRAKVGELEARVLAEFDREGNTPMDVQIAEICADIALVATLLADEINRSRPTRPGR